MNKITKKDIILNGKSMYASVHEPRTSQFEDQEPKTFYEMVVILDEESEEKIMKMAEGLKILDDIKGELVPLKRDEMGQAMVRVKKNDSFKNRAGEIIKIDPVKVFNKAGDQVKDLIGNGSDVTVHCNMGLFETKNGVYPFFQFKYVKLNALIKYEPKAKVSESGHDF